MSLLKTILRFVWEVVKAIGGLPLTIVRDGQEERITVFDFFTGQALDSVGAMSAAASRLFPKERTTIKDATTFQVSTPQMIVLG